MEGGDGGGEIAGALEYLQGAGVGKGALVRALEGQGHGLQAWEARKIETDSKAPSLGNRATPRAPSCGHLRPRLSAQRLLPFPPSQCMWKERVGALVLESGFWT